MNIWIDICHTPQYNFYKNFILRQASIGNTIYVTILDRGKTPQIIRHEIGDVAGVELFVIGKHRMKKWSAIFEANFLRLFKLLRWTKGRSIDIVFSNCMAAMILGYILRVPRYSFDDDPDTIDFIPKKWCSLESNYCLYEDAKVAAVGNNVHVLPCLKEWAYLAPNVFKHNIEALSEYGVQPKQYLFLREVSVGTVNYAEQKSGAILGIVDIIREQQHLHPELKVLLSLEEKYRRAEYPADWILLQEPIKDIHSLIYYSAGLISSGDSMAREAALLGVPAYYLGIRYDMPANAAAAKVAQLQNQKTQSVADWLHNTLSISPATADLYQQQLRKHIDKEFIDINKYMLRLVESVANPICAKYAQVRKE